MRVLALLCSLVVVALLLGHANATLRETILRRRQAGEREQEVTTPKSQVEFAGSDQPSVRPNVAPPQKQQEPTSLYPDLGAQAPGGFLPPFTGNRPFGQAGNGPTPFVPFGMNVNRFSDQNVPRVLTPPRQMSAIERAQSQTFMNGLGKRLLDMVGLGSSANSTEGSSRGELDNQSQAQAQGQGQNQNQAQLEDAMKALRNSTVLTQLNGGLNSVYNGLAKMYQENVEKQLNLLQDRFKEESANSSQPWQQRIAQQVPQFFKQMASRVEDAQANLNRMWQDATKVKNGTLDPQKIQQRPSNSIFGDSLNQLFGPQSNENNFFDTLSRPFGFGGGQQQPQASGEAGQQQKPDLGAQLMSFWYNEVSPQLGNMRNQLSRVWRDLTNSGALTFEPMVQLRNNMNRLGASNSPGERNESSELVDKILKEVDLNANEYILVEPKAEASEMNQQPQQPAQTDDRSNKVANQIQNSMVSAQRELNQLWLSLSNSLQNALKNVKQTVNPQPQFVNPFGPVRPEEAKKEADPAESELGSRIQDLSRLQRDADTVYTVVQQQQQQQQQRQSFGDRFRNFFNSVNLEDVDKLQNRFNEQVNRFGSAIGDFWHQIPEKWGSFIQGSRPQPNNNQQSSPAVGVGIGESTTARTTQANSSSRNIDA